MGTNLVASYAPCTFNECMKWVFNSNVIVFTTEVKLDLCKETKNIAYRCSFTKFLVNMYSLCNIYLGSGDNLILGQQWVRYPPMLKKNIFISTRKARTYLLIFKLVFALRFKFDNNPQQLKILYITKKLLKYQICFW